MELKIDWPSRGHNFNEDDFNIIRSILKNDKISLSKGKKVEEFEKKFSNLIGKYSLTTMSGAHSLDIAASLINTNLNDEIIIPAHTYCASALAFVRKGAKIRWADIDRDSLTISLKNIEDLVTKNTKAIVVVHLYGLICPEIEKISKFAKSKNIKLIEDCAQSLGARIGEKHCGSFGDIACFSFHSQKNITTLGEGGMISVGDINFVSKIKNLRHNGHESFSNQTEYWRPAMVDVKLIDKNQIPFKSTMSEIQGAIGCSLLDRLEEFTIRRRELSGYIRKKLSGCKSLVFQKFEIESSHSHHLLPARCISEKWKRDDLIKILYEKFKVKCVVQYYPLNRYDLFKKTCQNDDKLEETDSFFDNMISFPFSITLSQKQVDYLILSIKESIQTLEN